MKEHNIDYVNDSYIEGLQLTEDEATDVSLKHRLWFLKLQGVTQAQTQQSLALLRKIMKEGSSNFKRNTIQLSAQGAQITIPFGYTPLVQPQHPWTHNPFNQSYKPQEAARTSAFGSLVVPEANQYQIYTKPTMVPHNINRSSQEMRKRTSMDPIRNKLVNIQTTTYSTTQLTLSNKSSTIEVRLKDKRLSCAPICELSLILRDLHICANNHSLTNDERSQSVVDCLKGGALELYLKDISSHMTYQVVDDKLRARYNTPHRELSLQSEVDSLNFDDFMVHHLIQDEKECLHCMEEYLNNITSKLVDGFHTESNKIRYLRNAVLGKK